MSTLISNLINEVHEVMKRDDQKHVWAKPGEREMDVAAAKIADHYVECKSQRELIRRELCRIGSLWSLVLFVRRSGLLSATESGKQWFNRGLAVASMVDANCDPRDLIVSLVLLRALAAEAELESDEAFDNAMTWSSERMRGILTNARDHPSADVQATLASFGPK